MDELRQLDIQIARFMGWICIEDYEQGFAKWTSPEGKSHYCKPAYSAVVPDYSSDISAAMLVVEKLNEKFPHHPIVLWIRSEYTICQIWDEAENEIANCKADKPALAICRAAVKVIEGGMKR